MTINELDRTWKKKFVAWFELLIRH